MEEKIRELEARKKQALTSGGEARVRRQHELGRGVARERIEQLADPGTFLEMGMLNHALIPGMEDRTYGDGLIGGLAEVDGRPVVVTAADKTVLSATEGAAHIRKLDELHEYALRRRFPLIGLNEGGGLRIPYGMGSIGISENLFPLNMPRHNREVPSLTGIMGDSYGGPTWSAVTADINIQVKGTCMAVSGPRMLELATSEIVTEEELGGWRVHAEKTGQADRLAENDADCIDQIRECLAFLPSSSDEEPPYKKTDDKPDRRLDQAIEIVPDRMNRAYDMKRLIRLIADDGVFLELKEFYGKALITGLMRLNGRVAGVTASQPLYNAGASGPDEADKATDFICFCDSYNIPIIFLHDTPGFLVGSYAEHRKMPTKIMVWLQALAWSTVPKISIIIRKSIGASYANMCGPGMGADFIAAWPLAHISFTGDEVGVNVVYGRRLAQSANPAQERVELLKKWRYESGPYPAASKHLIDDVIDPRDTRMFLCRTLDYACLKKGSLSRRLLANWPAGF